VVSPLEAYEPSRTIRDCYAAVFELDRMSSWKQFFPIVLRTDTNEAPEPHPHCSIARIVAHSHGSHTGDTLAPTFLFFYPRLVSKYGTTSASNLFAVITS
jgi:hypothetical protein